mgnify:CR=1 FL=1|jgi:uncharacterized membrane protein
MKNRDLILILFLTISILILYESIHLYNILIFLLVLLAGYSLKTAFYPSGHGKENLLSFILTTLFTVLIAVSVFRFLGKTYLTPILLLIISTCIPVAFLRRRPARNDDLMVYKKGDKALKKYLEADKIVTKKVEENIKGYLICERCGGYYPIKEGESPEDFEKCQCGGELHYEVYDDELQPEVAEKKVESVKSTLEKIDDVIRETEGNIGPECSVSAIQTGSIVQNGGKESLEGDIEEIISRKIKRFIPYDLVFTFLFAGLCFLLLSVSPLNHLGKTFTTILMVFFPGYAIMVTMYPRRDEINLWERLGMSLMLSLLVTLVFAVVSRYRGTGTTSLFIIVSIMTTVLAVMAILVETRVMRDESFYGYLAESFSKLKASTWGRGDLTGKMTVVLIILFILSIVTTVYLIANPNPGESFTEFYILGPQGKAADYPTNVTAGKNQTVIVGIVNHEHKATNYTIVVQSNGTNMTTENITLQANQKLEIPYTFKLQKTGEKEVKFLLYKLPDTQSIYLSLHLWVNVK